MKEHRILAEVFSERGRGTHPCTPLKRGLRKAGMTEEDYRKAEGLRGS
jgi:hypothetical protein